MSTTEKMPAIVGHKEVCRILGCTSGNLDRQANLPPDLAQRGIPGFEVSVTRLWFRDEIEAMAADRAARQRSRSNGE
jgi:hypothetical protein